MAVGIPAPSSSMAELGGFSCLPEMANCAQCSGMHAPGAPERAGAKLRGREKGRPFIFPRDSTHIFFFCWEVEPGLLQEYKYLVLFLLTILFLSRWLRTSCSAPQPAVSRSGYKQAMGRVGLVNCVMFCRSAPRLKGWPKGVKLSGALHVPQYIFTVFKYSHFIWL